MAPEPKPAPCAWCHWPVRLVPAPPDPGAARTEADPTSADTDDAPRIRQCTNPWCPTRRPGFGVAP